MPEKLENLGGEEFSDESLSEHQKKRAEELEKDWDDYAEAQKAKRAVKGLEKSDEENVYARHIKDVMGSLSNYERKGNENKQIQCYAKLARLKLERMGYVLSDEEFKELLPIAKDCFASHKLIEKDGEEKNIEINRDFDIALSLLKEKLITQEDFDELISWHSANSISLSRFAIDEEIIKRWLIKNNK